MRPSADRQERRKENIMFINYEMGTIELTKAEAKEAGVFKSDMYNVLTEAREATGFKVVVKESKRKKDTLKGLTYAYMEVYIEKKAGERKEELQTELNALRGYVDGKRDILKEKSSYGEVREWFLEQFPEIKSYNDNFNKKRTEAREKKERQRIEKLIA